MIYGMHNMPWGMWVAFSSSGVFLRASYDVGPQLTQPFQLLFLLLWAATTSRLLEPWCNSVKD